jgi:hypothetical protein
MSPSPPRETEAASKSAPASECAPDRALDRATGRDRSRSPRRSPTRKPKNFSGLKWKNDKREDRDSRRGDDRRDRRDNDRDDRRRDDRDPRRRDDRFSDMRGDDRRRDDVRRRDNRDPERKSGDRKNDERDDRHPDRRHDSRKAPPPAMASTGEMMIIVTVNDRLGTKTQVPCLPSDPIKVLKAMVAAKIGRPVHEIMLKRQGERPFHDSLSLADYSISNGVQIDLELNTGD